MKLVLVIVLALGLNACAATGPYRGRVIDAETKQPLVGAVVLVYWNRLTPGLGHGPIESFLDADEALTNLHGEFIVAEHPPIVWAPWAWRSRPHLIIFQPGYAFFPRHAQTIPPFPSTGYDELLKIMEREHVVFELPRLATREEYIRTLRLLPPSIIPPSKMPTLTRLLGSGTRPLSTPLLPERRSE